MRAAPVRAAHAHVHHALRATKGVRTLRLNGPSLGLVRTASNGRMCATNVSVPELLPPPRGPVWWSSAGPAPTDGLCPTRGRVICPWKSRHCSVSAPTPAAPLGEAEVGPLDRSE